MYFVIIYKSAMSLCTMWFSLHLQWVCVLCDFLYIYNEFVYYVIFFKSTMSLCTMWSSIKSKMSLYTMWTDVGFLLLSYMNSPHLYSAGDSPKLIKKNIVKVWVYFRVLQRKKHTIYFHFMISVLVFPKITKMSPNNFFYFWFTVTL